MTRGLVVALVVVVAACTSPSTAPTPNPTASQTPAAVASPTPRPPTAPPSPTPTRYVNEVLGFAVTLPLSWRVSDCLSRATREGSFLGQDVLTWRTAAEEHDLGAGGDTGGSGALTWVITISAEVSAKTPAEYATTRGASILDKIDTTSIDDRPAVRVVATFGPALTYYVVADAGRMYSISLSAASFEPRPPLATDAAVDSIARSITFVTPTARPTPTLAPARSPAVESLVDAVTAAFAASDADRLRELMPPTCWFFSAGYQSSGTSVSREKYAEGLRTSFSKGLKVTVESRPIKTDAPFVKGPFWVWSSWSAYGTAPTTPQNTVQLVFDQIDGRWYWIGALFNAEALRRP